MELEGGNLKTRAEGSKKVIAEWSRDK